MIGPLLVKSTQQENIANRQFDTEAILQFALESS